MRIYIRHADKCYYNGSLSVSIYRHDSGITDLGRERARDLATKLISKWGMPKKVICSPYKRTRDTAQEMMLNVSIDVPLYCDINISEYLGNKRTEALDVEEQTSCWNPPHPEFLWMMKERVKKHNDMFQSFDESDEVIWIISHGIIIQQLIYLLQYQTKNKIPYLGVLLLSSNKKLFMVGDQLIDISDTRYIDWYRKKYSPTLSFGQLTDNRAPVRWRKYPYIKDKE